MSDAPKRDTNFDLERAEQKLIAAGEPVIADALYDYAQGIRNFVQGDFGQSFIDAYESMLVKHISPLKDNEATTERILGQVMQLLDEQRTMVQQILTAHKETVRGLKKTNARITDIDKRHGTQWKEAMELLNESKRDRADLRGRINAIAASQLGQEERDRLLAEHADLLRRVALLEALTPGVARDGDAQ